MSNELKHQINNHNPINSVVYLPLDAVVANDYNPNSVALKEMQLLYISIKADGYTQPVVVVPAEKEGMYTIVDGFHRYSVMRRYKDINELNGGMLPCVVLQGKSINDRMASTIRHNRARGKHSVSGMGNIVVEMLGKGVTESDICNQLGLEAEELLRLKHITGYAKLYENHDYSKPLMTLKQIEEKIRMEREAKDGVKPESKKKSKSKAKESLDAQYN